MATWDTGATAKDVREAMAAESSQQIPEPAAKLFAALIAAVGDVEHEPGVNPPDDAKLRLVA